MRKITSEYKEFQNDRGIEVYYNDLTCYITIAKGNNIIYEFYDGDTWETAVKQIVSTIQKNIKRPTGISLSVIFVLVNIYKN